MLQQESIQHSEMDIQLQSECQWLLGRSNLYISSESHKDSNSVNIQRIFKKCYYRKPPSGIEVCYSGKQSG